LSYIPLAQKRRCAGQSVLCLPRFAFLRFSYALFSVPRHAKPCRSGLPFRRGTTPLSLPLQSGIRFLDIPLPAPRSPFLAVGFLLKERDTGLPCFLSHAMEWGRSRLFAGGATSAHALLVKEHACPRTFWSSLTAPLARSTSRHLPAVHIC
jgi:hypothetical protein